MSLKRWFSGIYILGLTVAVTVTLALSAWLFHGAERDQWLQYERRLAQVEANALADALSAAGPDEIGRILKAWQSSRPERQSAVVIAGMEMIGSAKSEDQAPRRLIRAEKPLYDLANQLRAARETNLSEGVVRKKLIVFDEQAKDAFVVTVPYLDKGEFAGVLQIRMRHVETDVSGTVSYAGAALWISIFLAAIVLAALLHARPEMPRDAPKIVALAAFLGLTLFYQSQRLETFAAADLESTRRVASAVADAAKQHDVKAVSPAIVSRWDTDQYQRPLGVIRTDGAVVGDARDKLFAERAKLLERSLWAVEALGLVLLLAYLLGYMRRLADTVRHHAAAYAYVAPAMVGMLVLVFFPFLYGITLAFTDTTLFNESLPFSERWVGLVNFFAILGDFNLFTRNADGVIWNYQNFYWTLMVTIVWTLTNVTVGVTLGFILALILNTDNLKGKAIYRVILILPWAIPNYITALVWRGMFHPQFGVINQILQLFGMQPVGWFDGVVSSFFTGLATNGWLSFPFMMVVILGALQSIPKDMYEAAEVEGATRWQRLRHITLPLLRPTLVPAIVLSVVWTFNMFNIIFLVSGGEPAGANEILITKAYKIAFENYQYAYAAAYSTVIFVILLVYGVFQTRVTKATESY